MPQAKRQPMRIDRHFRYWVGAGLLCAMSAVQALEYRSVAVDAAILYDAPSNQSRKLAILSRYYPVETIVTLQHWVKVRDAAGALAWVELNQLSDKRTILVTASLTEVRAQPNETAPLVFKAERDVALELVEISNSSWVKVKHRDGQSGFMPIKDAWGL